MIYTLDEIKAIAAPIAQRYGITALYLFGSYARNEATENSDIDFHVERGSAPDPLALGGLFDELENSFHKKVDVLTTQMLSAEFLESIRSEKMLIYSENTEINHERSLPMSEVYRKLQEAENELADGKMVAGKAAFASLRAKHE